MANTRLEKLRNRRIDPMMKVGELNEAYKKLPTEDAAVQYAVGAMQPIDPAYTRITIEERERVEKQLKDGFATAGLDVVFDYQGSVTNDTHVRAYSDVDLLTIDNRSHSVQPPNKPVSPYQGNVIEDLREVRSNAATILKGAFPAATIDQTSGKAVKLSGGSLRREVDVIASNLWHTVEYVQHGSKQWLGIKILEHHKGERIANKPFLHNKRIQDRDVFSNGGLRRVIRLLKSLKYDSDDVINLSSYDITGIVFNMLDEQLFYRSGSDLLLVKHCQFYLRDLLTNSTLRNSIEVPNKMRKVFCADGASEAGLKQMSKAVDMLVGEIEQGLSRSFRKLAEARVSY